MVGIAKRWGYAPRAGRRIRSLVALLWLGGSAVFLGIAGAHGHLLVLAALYALLSGVLALACVSTGRTAQRQAERAQHAILAALQDGVLLLDEDGRVAFFNPSAERVLGVRGEELGGGTRHWDLLRPDGQPFPPDELPAAVTARTGQPCSGVEVGLQRADGTVRWLTVSAQALPTAPDAPPPHPVVVAFTDVTERREAVAALQHSNAELAQFAYVASHDLSEPLRMVSSYLQLLRRRYHGQIDEDADEFIDFAVGGANRMRALIEDLLAYSRAGRGAEPRPVDSGVVLADVLSSLAGAVADARGQVHVEPLPVVMGDRVTLAQLFQNLIANALKFRRGPSASVWVAAEPDGPTAWRFSVADDGVGIDPLHRERVFKMFQRAHGHDRFEGTGIGLAICRKIVERQGGRIWVENRDGGGTVFRFTLPAVPAPAAVPDPAPPEPVRARATA